MKFINSWTVIPMLSLLVTIFSVRGENVYTGSAVSTFPHDVPTNTNRLEVFDSPLLTEIDYFEHFPDLVKLTMERNGLETFPDLGNVSSTLKQLSLRNNQLSYIPPSYLDQLVCLELLKLSYNPLEMIPDVSGPSNTLAELHVEYTLIPFFPNLEKMGRNIKLLQLIGNLEMDPVISLESLLSLPRLETLVLVNIPKIELPNMMLLNYSQKADNQLDIYMAGSNFSECDERVIWTKLAMHAGMLTLTPDDYLCDSPSKLAWTMWTNITVEDLLNKGDMARDSLFEKIPGPYRISCCYPTIVEIFDSRSVIYCGGRCLKRADCYMFAVENGKCVITEHSDSLVPSTEDQFYMYTKWYIVRSEL